MEFVRVIEGFDHLWAVQEPDKEFDELTALFEKWNDAGFLLEFFKDNFYDLKNYFKIEKISQAIQDTFDDSDALEELILTFPYTENLDSIFKPLDITDTVNTELTRTMQDKEHTMVELAKLNRCKDFLRQNGVFDKDSFMDLNMED